VVLLKEIRYRGGLLTFRIPATWVEEYEEAGGGTFFEDRPDSGTLRLNVLGFRVPPPKAADPLRALETSSNAAQGSIRLLNPSLAVLEYAVSTNDTDGPIHIFWWELAHAPGPDFLRLALFSYTVAADRAHAPDTLDEIALLRTELARADFAPYVGALPDQP
jgi:hypothetical protein